MRYMAFLFSLLSSPVCAQQLTASQLAIQLDGAINGMAQNIESCQTSTTELKKVLTNLQKENADLKAKYESQPTEKP